MQFTLNYRLDITIISNNRQDIQDRSNKEMKEIF